MHLIDELERELGKKQLPDVHVGDTVEVHYLIREGEKERVQIFVGTVIAMSGRGIRKSINVRRIVQGEGVERIFPLHNPRVQEVKTTRRGEVRRSKLYFLRDRVGKRTRLKELISSRSAKPANEPAAEQRPEAGSSDEKPAAETVEV